MHFFPRLALSGLLAAALGLGRTAIAETPAPEAPARAEAVRKYTEGSRAFEEKKYKDAIDLFLEADSYLPSAALAYNTSVAYEAMGDAASALKWAREYLRRAPGAEDRAQVQATVDRLEARLREKGVQQLTVLSTPAGATVLIDDRPLGVTPWTGELRPGEHRVELTLTGHEASQAVFDLRPERSLELRLGLEVERPANEDKQDARPQARRAPPTPRIVDNTSADAVTMTGIVALGAGVAGLGTALGLELARAGAEDDVRNAETQIEAGEKLGTMEDFRLGARIAVGIGGGLAATGGALLIAGLLSHEHETVPKVAFGCDDTGCAFGLRGQF